MPDKLKPEDLLVFNATCTLCGEHIEGKLPKLSKAYLCPHCGKRNETVDAETVHGLGVYGKWHDLTKVRMLRPTTPPKEDMKVRCKCGNVFDVKGVYDGQIRICPKCGKSMEFEHTKQMCFSCHEIIDRIFPKGTLVIRCHHCGSYETPY